MISLSTICLGPQKDTKFDLVADKQIYIISSRAISNEGCACVFGPQRAEWPSDQGFIQR